MAAKKARSTVKTTVKKRTLNACGVRIIKGAGAPFSEQDPKRRFEIGK